MELSVGFPLVAAPCRWATGKQQLFSSSGRLFPFRASSSFLGGESVTNVGDRQKLAAILGKLLDSMQVLPVGHAALLLPAVQSAREAARRAQKLRDLGLSAVGAQQFVAGLPMNGADDRKILPQIVFVALGSALVSHGAGYNQMTLDDTAGKER